MDESEFNTVNFVPPIIHSILLTTIIISPLPHMEKWHTSAGLQFHHQACAFMKMMQYLDWKSSYLLMPILKGEGIFQLALDGNGTELVCEPVELFRSDNLYRDLAFSLGGQIIMQLQIHLVQYRQCKEDLLVRYGIQDHSASSNIMEGILQVIGPTVIDLNKEDDLLSLLFSEQKPIQKLI